MLTLASMVAATAVAVRDPAIMILKDIPIITTHPSSVAARSEYSDRSPDASIQADVSSLSAS